MSAWHAAGDEETAISGSVWTSRATARGTGLGVLTSICGCQSGEHGFTITASRWSSVTLRAHRGGARRPAPFADRGPVTTVSEATASLVLPSAQLSTILERRARLWALLGRAPSGASVSRSSSVSTRTAFGRPVRAIRTSIVAWRQHAVAGIPGRRAFLKDVRIGTLGGCPARLLRQRPSGDSDEMCGRARTSCEHRRPERSPRRPSLAPHSTWRGPGCVRSRRYASRGPNAPACVSATSTSYGARSPNAQTIAEVERRFISAETKRRSSKLSDPEVPNREAGPDLAMHRSGTGPDDLMFTSPEGCHYGAISLSGPSTLRYAGRPRPIPHFPLAQPHVAASLRVEHGEHPQVGTSRLQSAGRLSGRRGSPNRKPPLPNSC